MAKETNGVNIPAEASRQGGLNEGVDGFAQRGVFATDIAAGPDVGELGEYRPATYVVMPGITRIDR